MEDLGIIDKFVSTFSTYIDSGFGFLGGEVQYLVSILIAIDITLAGLYWAMGPETNVIGKFLKKVMYVGVFALIITNFAVLADIIFSSFGSLGLQATSTSISAEQLLKPGFIADVGFQAAHPILDEISRLTGPVKFFTNIVLIFVLALAWVITIFAFFFLAIQLFVTIIEFKLTTLAGFVLIPFALWNKTSFLAEKVIGNIIASGIKLMVLAIIIGIGSTIFGDITSMFGVPSGSPPGTKAPPIELQDAATVILASMAMFALGIFGPGIATGLVTGAPQLGAGAAMGTMAAIGGGALAGAAVGGAAARSGMAAGAGAIKAGAAMTGGSKVAFALGKMGSGAKGIKGAVAGMAGVAEAGARSVAGKAKAAVGAAGGAVSASHAGGMREGMRALSKGMKPIEAGGAGGGLGGSNGPPNWAKKVHGQQQRRELARAAHHTMGSTSGGSGSGPRLNPDE
jgi:type IV secretion system protein TrbL